MISGQLLALGPFIAPVLIAGFGGLTWLAGWLIDGSIERRPWKIGVARLIAGLAIAIYLTAVFVALVLP